MYNHSYRSAAQHEIPAKGVQLNTFTIHLQNDAGEDCEITKFADERKLNQLRLMASQLPATALETLSTDGIMYRIVSYWSGIFPKRVATFTILNDRKRRQLLAIAEEGMFASAAQFQAILHLCFRYPNLSKCFLVSYRCL